MGHGTRNANRAAGIADNKGLIGKVTERVKVLEATTKDDGPIDKRFRMHGHEIVKNAASIETSNATVGMVEERLRLLERPLWKRVLRMDTEKEEVEMPKDEEKKPEPPATPSHRQVVVDRKVPGPGKKGVEPNKTKAESRDV